MKLTQGYGVFAALLLMMNNNVMHAKSLCNQPDGSLVTTFGNHGITVTDMGIGNEGAAGVVVLPCGRIVAGGVSDVNFALAGYTSFGVLDSNFGMNGTVITDLAFELAQADVPVDTIPSIDAITAIALQKQCDGCADACSESCDLNCTPDIKIVAAGTSTATATGDTGLAVARYNPDGTLDKSFGPYGAGINVVLVGEELFINAMAIQADGKIVVVGSANAGPEGVKVFVVVRFTCDGLLDETFGCDRTGIVFISFGAPQQNAFAIAIQQDGKIVVGGSSNLLIIPPFNHNMFALVRLTTNGMLDKTFGVDRTGKVLTPFVDSNGQQRDAVMRALILLENCGSCIDCSDSLAIVGVGFYQGQNFNDRRIALAGYTHNGHLDRNFGPDHTGRVLTSLGQSTRAEAVAALLQRDCTGTCKIIVGGDARVASLLEFMVARYRLDGSLDTTFGIGGVAVTSFGIMLDAKINALARQKNGNLVAAGEVIEGGNGKFALASYKICTSCCIDECPQGCVSRIGDSK